MCARAASSTGEGTHRLNQGPVQARQPGGNEGLVTSRDTDQIDEHPGERGGVRVREGSCTCVKKEKWHKPWCPVKSWGWEYQCQLRFMGFNNRDNRYQHSYKSLFISTCAMCRDLCRHLATYPDREKHRQKWVHNTHTPQFCHLKGHTDVSILHVLLQNRHFLPSENGAGFFPPFEILWSPQQGD